MFQPEKALVQMNGQNNTINISNAKPRYSSIDDGNINVSFGSEYDKATLA